LKRERISGAEVAVEREETCKHLRREREERKEKEKEEKDEREVSGSE